MPRIPLSGEQHTLRSGSAVAIIASVGASLRSYTVDGVDLVVPFDADEVRPAYRGVTLAPWPNRVVDGRYALDGVEQQLAISEPPRHHALHGLVAWQDFALVDRTPGSVSLRTEIEPQAGYPFRVCVNVTFSLTPEGLRTVVTGENLSGGRAPFGTGPHPYLSIGRGLVDDWTLSLPASEVLTVTPDRLSPLEVVSVPAELDFRTPRALGTTFIDHAYTALARDDAGIATVLVTDGAGNGVGMRWDAACPWVQIHTADRPDAPEISRIGLAVEPMTCPPDAFNSGVDLIHLVPGETASASWEIFPVVASA